MTSGLAVLAAAGLVATAVAGALPKAERGRTEADCRPGEKGPAVEVQVDGMKDRAGSIYLEVYPPNDSDFLASDKRLIAEGKLFRRVPLSPIPQGAIRLCVRVPAPGSYSIIVVHDRDDDGRFSVWRDGIGIPGRSGPLTGRPPAAAARIDAGAGLTVARIVLAYRRGFRFDSLADKS